MDRVGEIYACMNTWSLYIGKEKMDRLFAYDVHCGVS